MSEMTIIIRKLQFTEKSTLRQEESNQYFFLVSPDANKIQVKQAVESLYGVEVANVNTLRYQGKRKRQRTARYGRRADWKRAVVTLKEGQSIDVA